VTSKWPPKRIHSNVTQVLLYCCPSNTKCSPNIKLLPPPAPHSQQSASHYLALSLPNAVPCYQPTFTTRTSGHSLRIFRELSFLFSLSVCNKNNKLNNNNNNKPGASHLIPSDFSPCLSLPIPNFHHMYRIMITIGPIYLILCHASQ